MATWLEQLQPASFKGVRFQVDSIESTVGDNVVLREYPFQDKPTVFRMGAAAQILKFSAYVVGDDYLDQLDALLEALTGDGDLVHPTAGTMRAFVMGPFTYKEAPAEEGGVARLELTFVRAEPRRYPTAITNPVAAATQAASDAKAASVDAFAAAFDLSESPGWAIESVIQRIDTSVQVIVAEIQPTLAELTDFTGQATAQYQSLRSSLTTLVNVPQQLGSSLANLFSLPEDMSAGIASAVSGSLESIFNRASTPADTVYLPTSDAVNMLGIGQASALYTQTQGQQQLIKANAALDQLVASLAIAALVQAQAALADAEPDAVDIGQTQRLRNLLYTQITQMLGSASESSDVTSTGLSWHDAMLNLLSAAIAELRSRPGAGNRLDTYTPKGWMPVWQVSYELYGTASYADEILALNPHIQNPLLVPPDQALTVVRHG